METSYSIVQRESEYRVLLTAANLSSLSDDILDVLDERNIDISDLLKDNIREVSGK
jgi:hypothetical protein